MTNKTASTVFTRIVTAGLFFAVGTVVADTMVQGLVGAPVWQVAVIYVLPAVIAIAALYGFGGRKAETKVAQTIDDKACPSCGAETGPEDEANTGDNPDFGTRVRYCAKCGWDDA